MCLFVWWKRVWFEYKAADWARGDASVWYYLLQLPSFWVAATSEAAAVCGGSASNRFWRDLFLVCLRMQIRGHSMLMRWQQIFRFICRDTHFVTNYCVDLLYTKHQKYLFLFPIQFHSTECDNLFYKKFNDWIILIFQRFLLYKKTKNAARNMNLMPAIFCPIKYLHSILQKILPSSDHIRHPFWAFYSMFCCFWCYALSLILCDNTWMAKMVRNVQFI